MGVGLALLLTAPLALVLSGVVGIWGSRFYARDVAALGASAEQMLGVSAASRPLPRLTSPPRPLPSAGGGLAVFAGDFGCEGAVGQWASAGRPYEWAA